MQNFGNLNPEQLIFQLFLPFEKLGKFKEGVKNICIDYTLLTFLPLLWYVFIRMLYRPRRSDCTMTSPWVLSGLFPGHSWLFDMPFLWRLWWLPYLRHRTFRFATTFRFAATHWGASWMWALWPNTLTRSCTMMRWIGQGSGRGSLRHLLVLIGILFLQFTRVWVMDKLHAAWNLPNCG